MVKPFWVKLSKEQNLFCKVNFSICSGQKEPAVHSRITICIGLGKIQPALVSSQSRLLDVDIRDNKVSAVCGAKFYRTVL